ncbi:MAG: hypothetical protein JWS12_562 [Candidatus Saccharibacteria bacterium]|nr:hypothetical protein [Candidatus Saccharibacteria bacterium]
MTDFQNPIEQFHPAVAAEGLTWPAAIPKQVNDSNVELFPREDSLAIHTAHIARHTPDALDELPAEEVGVIDFDAESPTFLGKLRTVIAAIRSDWKRESNAGKVWLVSAMVGQAGERTHLLTEATIAPIAAHVLRSTHSPWMTGVALFSMVGAAQEGIAATWVEGMHRAPETTEAVYTQFPKTIELAEDLGAATDRNLLSNVREGISSFATYGVTPYVVAEKLANPETTKKQSHITAAVMSGKCAVTGFVLGVGVGEFAVHNPAVGNHVVNWLEKPWIWWGITAVLEGPRLINKRLQRRKMRMAEAENASTEAVIDNEQLEES